MGLSGRANLPVGHAVNISIHKAYSLSKRLKQETKRGGVVQRGGLAGEQAQTSASQGSLAQALWLGAGGSVASPRRRLRGC